MYTRQIAHKQLRHDTDPIWASRHDPRDAHAQNAQNLGESRVGATVQSCDYNW